MLEQRTVKLTYAKWIWYPGDFEIYHHLLLSCRRQEFGCDYPCMWRVPSPEKTVSFAKDFEADEETEIKIVTWSRGMIRVDGSTFPVNSVFTIPAGQHHIEVVLYDIVAFPSLFVESKYLVSDESWTCEARDKRWFNVCCEPEYTSPEDDPKVFPFCYKAITPVGTERINGGILYDFGKETFGPVTIGGVKSLEGVKLIYGESRPEALSEEWSIIRDWLKEGDSAKRPARAFRYIHASATDGSDVKLSAEYEYLPLEDKASFECENPLVKEIWDTCVYTFHLNSREFFLDGIKRDRWVWSGDAYQSFMINRCLFADNAIAERTITALLGKPPYNTHVNTINDYSAYLIIAVYEHFVASGRTQFVKRIWGNLKLLFDFIVSRLDDDGLSCRRPGDWVFIDWGVLDKEGPNCLEQILLWRVYNVMTELSAVVGDDNDYSAQSDKLAGLINARYWNEGEGAFIDSYTSGKNFVSRQTNVFAVLFGFADDGQKQSIIKNVFENPSLPAITTPYFKLYELLALCQCGMIKKAHEYVISYWGSMLKEGATSIWEAYDETQTGDEHFAMYGTPYAKSLCHAWGSGPILLLIGYTMGLKSTSLGGKTFEIAPQAGIFGSFKAKAPIGNGFAEIEYNNGRIKVYSSVDGGTLIWNGQRIPIPAGKEIMA